MKKLLKTPILEEYTSADCEYWLRDKGSDKNYEVVGFFSMIGENLATCFQESCIAINVNFEI